MESPKPTTSSDVVSFVRAGIAAAFCIVAFQIYHLLRFGEWMPLSVIWALRRTGVSWALYPNDWLGVYKFLDWLPLSFSAIAVGLILEVSWPTSSEPPRNQS